MTVTRVPASNPEPEVPITDPRWLVSTQPDREPEPKPDVHWVTAESSMTWNNPIGGIACGAEGLGDTRLDKVTCAECLSVVMRRRCLVLEDAPGPLRQRCTRPVHDDDRHSWRWDSAGLPGPTSTEPDTPSGRLPVRTPGAALEEEREVIERWPA